LRKRLIFGAQAKFESYDQILDRFRRLLGTSFRHLNFKLAMRYELSNYVSAVNFLHSNFWFCIFSSVLASKIDYSNHEPSEYDNNSTLKLLGDMLSPHDMKRHIRTI
jgi:N-acetyltransferase 10